MALFKTYIAGSTLSCVLLSGCIQGFAPQLFAQSLSELKLRGFTLQGDGGDTYTASNGLQTLFVSASESGGAGSPRYEINITPAT